MNKSSIITICILLFNYTAFSQEKTINVHINLNRIANKTCEVKLYPDSNIKSGELHFPAAIPGTYEIQNFGRYINSPRIIKSNGDTLHVHKKGNTIFLNESNYKQIIYESREFKSRNTNTCPEGTVFQDSVYLLNWHLLVGYFEKHKDVKYQLTITKPKDYWGATSMNKTQLNDTTDVYTAKSYSELIHSPVLYCLPDTCSFTSGKSKINIASYSSTKRYKSKYIKQKLEKVIYKCLKASHFQPENYTFIYYIDNTPSQIFSALEHTNSSVTCFPACIKEPEKLINTSVHEFCHSLFAPLHFESEKLAHMNYFNPECDEHLWFYEGVTEYISLKLSFQSGVIDTTNFVKHLHGCSLNLTNENLSKVSKNIYSKNGQKKFMEFYTKGCLVAYLLDLELIEKSNKEMSLIKLLQKLQDATSKKSYFDEKNFLEQLSSLSGVDLSDFFDSYLKSKRKINFTNNIERIGCKLETIPYDTMVYSYNIKEMKFNTKTQIHYIEIKNSEINVQTGIDLLKISKIEGRDATQFGSDYFFYPQKADLNLTIIGNNGTEDIIVKAGKIKRQYYNRLVTHVKSPNKLIERYYWDN